uniref:TLDc domain-containing protein n=1 Tax=Bursaphelenchus xylophilus TaxID=6326 RepID=A0A1I7SG09_BURXY
MEDVEIWGGKIFAAYKYHLWHFTAVTNGKCKRLMNCEDRGGRTQLNKDDPVYEYVMHPSFGRCIVFKTENENVYSKDDIENTYDIQDFYLLRNNDYDLESTNDDQTLFAGFMYNAKFGFLNRIGMSPGNFLQINVDGFTETVVGLEN